MTEKKRKVTSKIPEFKSREEEAEFWDTHDTTDFEDEFKPVELRFADDFKHSIVVDLDPETFIELSQHAQQKGTDIITLAKMWILEQLKQEHKSSHT